MVEQEQSEDMIEVVELESELGENEEFMILERFQIEDSEYAILLPVANANSMEDLMVERDAKGEDITEEEWDEFYMSQIIMRITDESFYELEDDEAETIMVQIQTIVAARQAAEDAEEDESEEEA